MALKRFYEFVENKLGVSGATACLRVELSREERFALVSDAFVCAVVHINEKWFPIATYTAVVNGKAMVLRSNETAVCAQLAHRLIVAAMAVFQLIHFCTCSLRQQLIAHANATNGLVAVKGLANVFYSDSGKVGIARTVRNKQSVELHLIEIVIPRHSHNFHPTLC